MYKTFGKAGVFLAGMTLAACGGGSGAGLPGTGSVNFDLAIPGGQTVDTINLDIVCPGVNQKHVLNVVKGEVVASFGGLTPGACTVTLASQATDGTDCAGTKAFTVAAGAVSNVEVTLTCQSKNTSADGAAKITTKFDQRSCADDRIKKIFAIPSNLLITESTVVQAEINTAAAVGAPKYSWKLRNDATHTGQGTLVASTACAATSASCQQFTCTGLGATPAVDPRTGLPTAGVFVTLTYEDDNCFDTEEVWVDCIQSSICGDGTLAGGEKCDDGNKLPNDGCTAACEIERCGDGIVQTSEVCDGSAPVGFTCAVDCKSTVAIPVGAKCGDNIKNQPTEECDGTATPAGQVCSATCKITPVCGNSIVEAGEECDATGPTCVMCKKPVTGSACNTCIAAIPDIGAFNNTACQPDGQCKAALSCILANPTCWSALAPAACYCGNTQADIDGCESPAFVPKGACAAQLKAGAANGTNAEVLARYFDFAFPTGTATVIVDAAFVGCKAQCF